MHARLIARKMHVQNSSKLRDIAIRRQREDIAKQTNITSEFRDIQGPNMHEDRASGKGKIEVLIKRKSG